MCANGEVGILAGLQRASRAQGDIEVAQLRKYRTMHCQAAPEDESTGRRGGAVALDPIAQSDREIQVLRAAQQDLPAYDGWSGASAVSEKNAVEEIPVDATIIVCECDDRALACGYAGVAGM